MDEPPPPELTRVPDENDLVKLARELNRLGVAASLVERIDPNALVRAGGHAIAGGRDSRGSGCKYFN